MKQFLPHRSTAMTSWVLACVAVTVTLHSHTVTYSATLFYLSANGLGENAAPESPQETLKFLPGGGSFHIWVQPDTQFTGISLDLQLIGSAVRFTGSTVHNPSVESDTRWLPSLIRNGTVTDMQVSRIEGGALVPLTGVGTGIGPATGAGDPFYETNGGFLFATVDFAVLNPAATATVSLSIGHNLLSDTSGLTMSPIFLGVADGPVANSPGATGTAVDLKLIPRPLHAADFDSDGDVDGHDFLIWQQGGSPSPLSAGDLANWQANYGTGSLVATSVAVPEPSTVLLLMLATAGGLVSRRTA